MGSGTNLGFASFSRYVDRVINRRTAWHRGVLDVGGPAGQVNFSPGGGLATLQAATHEIFQHGIDGLRRAGLDQETAQAFIRQADRVQVERALEERDGWVYPCRGVELFFIERIE